MLVAEYALISGYNASIYQNQDTKPRERDVSIDCNKINFGLENYKIAVNLPVISIPSKFSGLEEIRKDLLIPVRDAVVKDLQPCMETVGALFGFINREKSPNPHIFYEFSGKACGCDIEYWFMTLSRWVV